MLGHGARHRDPQRPAGSGNGASADGAVFDVHRPADGSLIRQVPVDPPERVAEVVARVRAAQPEWEAIGLRRPAPLARAPSRLDPSTTRPALDDVMQEETGKVRAEAEHEAPFICGTINYYCENAAGVPRRRDPPPHTSCR